MHGHAMLCYAMLFMLCVAYGGLGAVVCAQDPPEAALDLLQGEHAGAFQGVRVQGYMGTWV
eukprot:2932804-Heterocapsa_arctica.AAC.1